jgi:hypothetical protein
MNTNSPLTHRLHGLPGPAAARAAFAANAWAAVPANRGSPHGCQTSPGQPAAPRAPDPAGAGTSRRPA